MILFRTLTVYDDSEQIQGENMAAALSYAGVTLSIEIAAVSVRGSQDDLALLVRNLLSNAIHYTSQGGQVTVRLAPTDGWSALTVRDTGIGIPRRDLDRVFERFYRVDRARSRETGGTGLGLSIVRHVAENHGGTVTVESELGVGSTFTVELPASDCGRATKSEPAAEAAHGSEVRP